MRDSPLSITPSSYYPSWRRSSRSCSPPSLKSSLPQAFVQNSLQYHLYEPPTIYPLNKAPILHHPSTTASSGCNTEQLVLLHNHTSSIGNHFSSPDPFASFETSASHPTSSIEYWINKTLLGTSSSTLAKALERLPPFTQPSSPTTPSLGKRKRSLSPTDQGSRGAELQPLTRKLLRLHTKNMASNNLPQTPTKGDGQGNTAGPPTPSSGSTGSNIDPKWVKMRMVFHHIYRQSSAFERDDYREFRQRVFAPIAPERGSAVKPGENEALKKIYKTCVNIGATEATFKREMLDHIIKKDFNVLAVPGDDSKGIKPVFESRSVLGGGVFSQAEQPLRRGFLPHNYPTTFSPKDIAGKLTIDGMHNSVPDTTWGYLGQDLDPISEGATTQDYTNSLLTICPGLFCPFFILEVKVDNGSMEVCRNQAARRCATIVSVMRELLRKLGRRKDTLGPDENTYIYCATMSTDFIEWWVGWAEVCEGERVSWHMNKLRTELFDQENPLLVMRRAMHNIMEWGLMTRLPIIKKLVSELQAKEGPQLAGKKNTGPLDSPSPAKKLKGTHPIGSGMEG